MSYNTTSIKVTDENPCFAISGAHVNLLVNSDRGQVHGSSRVKLKNIVDYKWEVKKYHGRLVAVHRDRQVIAYSIKLKTGGMVRVVWNEERALIKGMSTEVLDLQFAHMSSKVLLGCIDDQSLHVYRVDTSAGKLETTLLLKVDNIAEDVPISCHRLNWCPFVPSAAAASSTATANSSGPDAGSTAAAGGVEGADEEYPNHMLVWCQGDTFQALNVHLIEEAHGLGSYDLADLTEGVITHRESKARITVATISPDGTTMAVGFDDGNVNFYQMYFFSKESTPRRLHNWKPHENRPVTALAFLDDHTRPNPETVPFWQHVLTATDNNTELKLWRCRDWACVQRICFKPTAFDAYLDFKLAVDPSSSYLVLSEQNNKVLYALHIDKAPSPQPETGGADAEPEVSFRSVAEFPLSSSILSFCIAGAAKGLYNCGGRLEEDDYDPLDMDVETPMVGVMLQMFLVQPKSVQECQVFFQTEDPAQPEIVDSSAMEDMVLTPTVTNSNSSATLRQKSSAQINLMTPESFQSPPSQSQQASAKPQTEEIVSNAVLDTIRMLAAATFGSPAVTGADAKPNAAVKDQMLSYAAIEEQNLKKSLAALDPTNSSSGSSKNSATTSGNAPMPGVILPSGNSSPSREVQEILSLKDEMFENHMQLSDGDLEFEGNSSNGAANEEDDEDDDSDDNRQLKSAAASSSVTTTTTNVSNAATGAEKVIDSINAIQRFVDDDDDEEEDPEDDSNEVVAPNQQTTQKKAVAEEVTSNSSKDWPQVPNILPDMATRLGADPAALNNLNVVDSTDGLGHGNHHQHAQNAVVVEKLDRILDKIESLERRLNQIEKRPPPAQVVADMQQQMAQAVDGLKGSVQYEMAGQMQAMRESLAQMCSSKALSEAFSGAVRNALQATVHPVLAEQVAKVMVPAYERVTREMFKQTNDLFQKGVHGYAKQMQGYMAQYQPVHEQQEKLVAAMAVLPEQFRVTNEKVINSFSAQLIHEVNKDFKTLQLNVLKMVKEAVKQEVHKGFESQAASLEDSVRSAVRSQAQTPSVFDIQEQIRQLIGQGQINKAFHQALISNDLNLVEFTLQTADPKDVFNPCRLEQTVLLSLIQQLSADMSAYTNAKHQYLSEAITSLNMSDTVIREHAPKILKQLTKNLQKYCEERPNGEFGSKIRMLMMLAGYVMNS